MKKNKSKTTKKNVLKLEPSDKRKVNFSKFKPELSVNDIGELLGVSASTSLAPGFNLPIETLSVTKTVGLGRTNLTIIRPTTVQADSNVPRVFYDRTQTGARNPAISIHFDPIAYGINTRLNFVMEFLIDNKAKSTFDRNGLAAGPGGTQLIVNPGPIVVETGFVTVQLVYKNVGVGNQSFGVIEQVAGGPWEWYATNVRFPPLVATQ